MLESLKINNFLLFKDQEVFFEGSFTVISGETGSGKSMFIKALRFVLGEKLDIFDNSEISVIAEFRLNQASKILRDLLSENDIDLEDEVIILRRTLNSENKGKAFVNDVNVTTKFLKRVSEELVEFHSQHKQLEAFSQTNSLNIIDQFAKNTQLTEKISSLYQLVGKLNIEIEAKQKELNQLEDEKEYMEHSFKEIDLLHLKEGEELELIERKKLFSDKVKIIRAIETLLTNFIKDDSIVQSLLKAQRNLIKLDYETGLEDFIETAIFHLDELQTQAELKLKDFDTSENMEAIEERLSKIKELSRKYRCTSDQLLVIAQGFQVNLKNLSGIEQYIKNKKTERELLLKEYFIIAEQLSQKRKAEARILEEKILAELKQLKLEQVEFFIEVESSLLRPINIRGIDQAKFLIKTNKGFAFSQINETASGGELSRIMLAFKVALAEINQKTTIIFDEIDAGTGGAVAETIGNRMKELAKSNQIIAISHQPQVAAKASQHLLVEKRNDSIAQTQIKNLKNNDKIQEIARMLSGINVTESAVQAAISLIEG
jgi:DNA repair protein RecN (Recombination protein N)